MRRELPQNPELVQLKDRYTNALFNAKCIKVADSINTRFTLRNGEKSWIFVDHGLLLPNPQTNTSFVEAMSHAVKTDFPQATTILANVDSKSSPQTTGALAYSLEYRQIAVNPEATAALEHGTNLRLRMPEVKDGDTILVIDDVMTPKDTTIIDTVAKIRKELGVKADTVKFHALVGLMRDPIAVEELAQHGITAHYLTTLSEVLQNNWGKLSLTPDQRREVEKEL